MRLVTGIVLIIAGAVWLLQGMDVGFAPQSFMSGNRTWILFGALAVVIGLGLTWTGRRR
jgi:hypothetical protein